jgi:signal transduction histidine kinase
MLLGWMKMCFVALITAFLSINAHSQNSNELLPETVELRRGESILLLAYSELLEDAQGIFTPAQAIESKEWVAVGKNDLNLGITDSTYWFKVSVKYAEEQNRIFQIHYPLLDYVDFYLLKNQKIITHTATGDALPFNTRPIKNKDFVFSHLDGENQTLTILIKVKTQGTMVLPLSSVDIEYYAQEESLEALGYGIYYGISLAMLLYNLMLFVYLKDKSYLYYCVFVLIVLISALAYTGHGFYYLWPENNELNQYITPVASAVGFMASALFMASFLQLKTRGRWGKKVYYSCISLSGIVIVLSILFSYSDSIKVMSLAQLALTVMFLGTSIYLWSRGVSEAKYFTIAWLFFIAGNMITSFRVLGIVPSSFFTVYANLFGNVMEMLLFSMGLAHRFETMRKIQLELSRKLRFAQQDAIENLEKYRDLFQQSPVGLFRYERASDEFYNNKKSNELINKHENIRRFMQDELTFSDYKSLLKNNEIKDKAIKYDSDKYYNLSLLVVRGESGEVIEVEGSLLDISDQKKAEVAKITNEKEKLNTLTQLVVGISHQFNTPLGVLVTTEDLVKNNLSEILKNIDDGKLQKDGLLQTLYMVQDAMDLSSENTKVMSRILKDLRYSISTRRDLNLTDIDLGNMFIDLLGYYRSQLKEGGLNCSFAVEVATNNVVNLRCDYDVISDVILRLYANTNSHAYTLPADNIDKQSLEEGQVKINLTENEDTVYIEYYDNGRGLEASEKENIFIPFFTGNSRKKENSGLGMFILHNQVVKILQGNIELLSPKIGFGIKIGIPKVYNDSV